MLGELFIGGGQTPPPCTGADHFKHVRAQCIFDDVSTHFRDSIVAQCASVCACSARQLGSTLVPLLLECCCGHNLRVGGHRLVQQA